MFTYAFENDLYKGQIRKMILNFPCPQWILDLLEKDGWRRIQVTFG